jgi:uncharacterized protein with FMN-binding domain
MKKLDDETLDKLRFAAVLTMTNEEFGITSTLKKYADGVLYSHTISAAIGELRIEVDITDPRTRDAQLAAFCEQYNDAKAGTPVVERQVCPVCSTEDPKNHKPDCYWV